MIVVDENGVAQGTLGILVVSPSAAPPPDCSRAAFTPRFLASRLNTQICTATKVNLPLSAELLCAMGRKATDPMHQQGVCRSWWPKGALGTVHALLIVPHYLRPRPLLHRRHSLASGLGLPPTWS